MHLVKDTRCPGVRRVVKKQQTRGRDPATVPRNIVAENGKSITVSLSESVFHGSESVPETVNRYCFSV